MKQDTFEDYLQERHAAQYQGLDDEMGEDFDDWIADLDVETLFQYGDLYGEKRFVAGMKHTVSLIKPI